MANQSKLFEERTTLRSWLISISMGVVGGVLLFITTFGGFSEWWADREAVRQLIFGFGFFFLAPVAIGLLWEIFLRRSFVDEIINRIRMAEEIKNAGIIGYTNDFYHDIAWNSLFAAAKEIDIFFSYGSTWRNTNENNFKEFIRRGGKLRVVLPDPEDNDTVQELSRRYYYHVEELQTRINEAINFFKGLRSGGTGSGIKVWVLKKPPLFAYYRFDDRIIITLFNHREGRPGVPVISAQREGKLGNFAISEFEAFVTGDGQEEPLAKPLSL